MSNEDAKTLIALTKDKNVLLWKINDNLKVVVLAIKIVFFLATLFVLSNAIL